MTKNRARKQAVRTAAQAAGVSYTTALRQLERQTPPAPVVTVGTAADGTPVTIGLDRSWAITGAAGTGKSVLANRIAAQAARAGVAVYRVGRDYARRVSAEPVALERDVAYGRHPVNEYPRKVQDVHAAAKANPGRTLLVLDDAVELVRNLQHYAARIPDSAAALAALEDSAAFDGMSIIVVRQDFTPDAWAAKVDGHVELRRGAGLVDDHAFVPDDSDGRAVDNCVHLADERLCLLSAAEHADAPPGPENRPWHRAGTLVTPDAAPVDFLALAMPVHGPDLAVGDRVQFVESKRWWKVRAVSGSGRYVALSSPHNLAATNFYTVIDRHAGVRGPDDRVLGLGWQSDDDFVRNLAELDAGRVGISHRHRVPLDVATVRPPR